MVVNWKEMLSIMFFMFNKKKSLKIFSYEAKQYGGATDHKKSCLQFGLMLRS